MEFCGKSKKSRLATPRFPISKRIYKHNMTTMLHYINIYIIIGAIISALALLMNNHFVKYDEGTPLQHKDVLIIIFFWPIFLGFLLYYFFIKDWDN
jgi:H+/Cl- antiporter ClcA